MSISGVFDNINSGTLVIPALQRNYVWKEEQICNLFDSLMKGYPIGSFLFWRVSEEDRTNYHFHSFKQDIDITNKNNLDGVRGPQIAPQPLITAVLDGQQRLTSILIGLKGSYKSVVKRTRRNADGTNPVRYLALNLLHFVNNTQSENYEFDFLSDTEIQMRDENHYWFKLSNIFNQNFNSNNIIDYVVDLNITNDLKIGQKITNMLTRLYNLVFEDSNITYYTAINKDLSEAVEIFERVNNNGKQVSGTDLMLSMASADSGEDMHIKITEAITQISNATNNETGFAPDRDFILTAMLMASNNDNVISTTAKANYSSTSIESINSCWEDVVDAITNAAIYIEELGFNGRKLGKTFLHPITYYFYKRREDELDAHNYAVSTSEDAQADRSNITQWLLRAQIKQIFAYGITSTLGQIRTQMNEAMDESETNPNPTNEFPLQHLIESATEKKSLTISTRDIDDILKWEYGNEKIVPLFTVILRESLGSFDVDHIWPQEKMSSDTKIIRAARALNVTLTDDQIKAYKENYNLLPNLQLLKRTPNSQKSQDCFNEWIYKAYPEEAVRNMYIANYCIPTETSWSYENFVNFYAARKSMLTERLRTYFNVRE